ncbi:hypothetical protein DICVIV_13760 [Dictyocaulus viviparus]|uniref:Uncharacterized protein n=1 Tax=Dictyocaulus viviparus TaxID=29172 RepID=A0A0D8X9J5_DICVI|nr:hypothetical protein DICVIV_13760 [Dictyocaulus viviparus]
MKFYRQGQKRKRRRKRNEALDVDIYSLTFPLYISNDVLKNDCVNRFDMFSQGDRIKRKLIKHSSNCAELPYSFDADHQEIFRIMQITILVFLMISIFAILVNSGLLLPCLDFLCREKCLKETIYNYDGLCDSEGRCNCLCT